jgi:hypothetical protein
MRLDQNWKETGSLAVTFSFLAGVVILGFIVISVFYPIESAITTVWNTFVSSGTIYFFPSQQSAMNVTQLALHDYGLVAFICICLWAVIHSKTRRDDEV